MASINRPADSSASRPGRVGVYGGRYVPETLVAALDELVQFPEIGRPGRILRVLHGALQWPDEMAE
jgi:plasmid stabilization system protein ParE